MATLIATIDLLRRRVPREAKYFVPNSDTAKLFSQPVILDALRDCEFAPCIDLNEICRRIHNGARRIFAILTVLSCQKEILRFLEKDHLQSSPLDHRLPMSLSDVREIIPEVATRFYEKQWEFCAPVFCEGTSHRSLDIFTSMPFIEDTKIGEGGFGEVFRVIIHEGHSLMEIRKGVALARKQFREILDLEDATHERELHNLCLLNRLRHPNILPLVSFYTYKNRRNFLFPFADGGDLETLLQTESRPLEFQSNFRFWLALTHLSSALERMHRFASDEDLDLAIIGLHRDLKPQNILVSNGDFILADFGLSRFKPEGSKSSKTPFRGGGGNYLAPECEDIDNSMAKGIIGRASDLWSFGCILTEILVYMAFGNHGLAEFRKDRKVQIPGWAWTIGVFHGPGPKVNEHVERILKRLTSEAWPMELGVRLIKDLLHVDAAKRPNAITVQKRLQYIAIGERLQPVCDMFGKLLELTHSAQARLENERLRVWMYTVGFPAHSETDLIAPVEYYYDFEQTLALLYQVENELSAIILRQKFAAHPLYTELRQAIDRLWETMPDELQRRALMLLERHLMDETDDVTAELDLLGDETRNNDALKRRIYYTRFLRQLVKQADETTANLMRDRVASGKADLSLKFEDVVLTQPFSNGHIGRMKGEHKQIYVEWIRYDVNWEGRFEEMIARVGNIAVFLHEAVDEANTLRMLRCKGYFHSTTSHAFGLTYEIPLDDLLMPQNLHAMILETRGKLNSPMLGHRFKLAYLLASTLFEIHRATLLHKNLSTSNIIFLVEKNQKGPVSLLSPWLVGFNYARSSDPTAFTTGPPPSKDAQRYYHPDYSYQAMWRGERYRHSLDYYSLGLVLLEIGLWDPVVTSTEADSAIVLRKVLMKKRLPLLGFTMGKKYQDVVTLCLDGRFDKCEKTGEDVLQHFYDLGVQPLRELGDNAC